MNETSVETLLEKITFGENGLVAAVAQQQDSGLVLMQAWMNREALRLTLETGEVHYWSRSRNKIWRKGETSGQTQKLAELRIDCDGDSLLLMVDQKGVACHTGRKTCYFTAYRNSSLTEIMPPEIPPEKLYGKD